MMVEIVEYSILLLILITLFLIWKLFQKNIEISKINQLIIDMQYQHKELIKKAEIEARKDSTFRQRSTIKGQITETLAPWSMTVVNSVKELNFLGNPIDFVGFNGLDGEGEVDIKFIEVKDGKSRLNKNQRRVRDAVLKKRIEWVEVRIKEIEIEEKIVH